MGRIRSLFFAAVGCWAMVIMPALCAGGVITHPCECPSSLETGHEDAHHDETDEGCGHENNCATDPCSEIVTRPDDDHASTSELNPAEYLTLVSSSLLEPSCIASTIWSSPPSWFDGTSVHDALATTKLLI